MMNFIQDENGQGMVEYGLILALVAIAAVAALKLLGPSITSLFTKANTELSGSITT